MRNRRARSSAPTRRQWCMRFTTQWANAEATYFARPQQSFPITTGCLRFPVAEGKLLVRRDMPHTPKMAKANASLASVGTPSRSDGMRSTPGTDAASCAIIKGFLAPPPDDQLLDFGS